METKKQFVSYKQLIFRLSQYSEYVTDWKPRNQI